MSKITVVYHSGFGHTKLQAEAVAKGANASLMSVEAIDWQILEESDAIIFGCPTYMGGVSSPFKKFMDDTGKIWLKQGWKNKIAAGFTNSSSMSGDKLSSLIQLTIFAAQHGMVWVGAEHDADSDRFGSCLGAMAQSENAPATATNPPAKDLARAEKFGSRIAEVSKKLLG